MIKTKSISVNNRPAQGLEVDWCGGQFVMIIAEKGIVSCGIFDIEVANKFNFPVAVARGTKEKPLKTTEDLLSAKIVAVSDIAKNEYGIEQGITGEEALMKLSRQ